MPAKSYPNRHSASSTAPQGRKQVIGRKSHFGGKVDGCMIYKSIKKIRCTGSINIAIKTPRLSQEATFTFRFPGSF